MRQQLRFIRSKDGKEVPVGRFIAMFKIINESTDGEIKNYNKDTRMMPDPMANFPEYDPTFSFAWRVLAHIRTASNLSS